MATVILDFDSTLITCESLEEIFIKKKLDPTLVHEMKEITDQGMSGAIPFLDSLKERLKLAPVYKQDFIDFGREAVGYLTPGMTDLVKELQKKFVDIWIFSGAVRDVILLVGAELKIPPEKIIGMELDWTEKGKFQGFDESIPINQSKFEAAKYYVAKWSHPVIVVGDGMTDYNIYEHKLADYFIAYTQNARRQAVLDKGVVEANSVTELSKQLRGIIDG
jgi:phosphoserine phosphatase